MTPRRKKRINWQDAPTVFVVAPTCPSCYSTSYRTTKSEPNGDGSTTRKAICRDCNQVFKICVELTPDFGN